MLRTNTLLLLPVERAHIEAFLRGKSELAAMLKVTVPESWPHFPEAFSLPPNDEQTQTEWPGYFFIHARDRILVGNGGFKGGPDEAGIVEIGYEIATEYWGRGYATEAARAMIECAFAHEPVRAVIAHTLAEVNASNRVLQKAGMKFVAEVDDAEVGKIWRWQISRDGTRLA